LRTRRKKPIVGPVGAKGFELVIGSGVDPKVLGAQLRRLRENAGVSVTDLAERMEWKPQNVSRLESGGDKREPTISSVNLYLRMLSQELVLVARPKRGRETRASAQEGPKGASRDDE
jgi:predicted transcriptional regulator